VVEPHLKSIIGRGFVDQLFISEEDSEPHVHFILRLVLTIVLCGVGQELDFVLKGRTLDEGGLSADKRDQKGNQSH
jgi:hypothetical protein